MADDPNRIDPRYDPAFQRGYDGDLRTQPRADSSLRRTVAASAVHERVTPATPMPAAASPEPRDDAVPVPTASEPVGATAAPAAETVAIAAEPAASARDVTRNPFYLAAAGLAVLLIVGGAVWLNQGFAAIADGRAASDVGFYAASTMAVGAPLLIGIGILIVAGLLFVLARGWRPRDDG